MSRSEYGPFRVGDITVTILNAGDLKHSLRDSMGLPDSAWQGRYDELFQNWIPVPVQCALIQAPGATILVDAPSSDLGDDESPMLVPNYTPPPSINSRLAALGIQPEDITHIVISHTHFDHFNGLAEITEAGPVAVYPQAQVLIGEADWEAQRTNPDFVAQTSQGAKMWAPYHAAGQIVPVTSPVVLAPGVTVIPSPSETMGHLTVSVQSGGENLYCTGDIYHHWTEVENRTWMVKWADSGLTVGERLKLEERALAEDALLMASHIAGVGRLVRTDEGVRWETVKIPE